MRLAQYRMPGEPATANAWCSTSGRARAAIRSSNAERWAGQFTQPDGERRRSNRDADQPELETRRGSQVLCWSSRGELTTGDVDERARRRSRSNVTRLLGRYRPGQPMRPWFFKFTGPDATVRTRNVAAFVAMMDALDTDG